MEREAMRAREETANSPGVAHLLAVDLGVKTGLALYSQDGKLQWYRSHNFGSVPRLRRAVPGLLHAIPQLAWLILEGGGVIADIWKREAARQHIAVRQIHAETWRQVLLYPRQQRDGAMAKNSAIAMAQEEIVRSGARRPTALRDDAAEAILIGLWGVLEVDWITAGHRRGGR